MEGRPSKAFGPPGSGLPVADDAPGILAPMRAHAAALSLLWLPAALLVAALTTMLGAPGAEFAAGPPTPAQTVEALARLAAQLLAELVVIVLLAAPTARVVQGAALGDALRALARRGPWGVAGFVGLLVSFALLLTMLPGLMALYVNPLMGLLFLTVGTIGGAALAVGLFGRWMFAPALAAQGLGAAEALDASRAEAKERGNFGFAAGMAVLFALVLGAGAAAGGLAALLVPGQPLAGRTLGMALALAPLLPIVPAAVAQRHAGARAAASAPALALRSRQTRCPRCGELARAPVGTAGSEVACPGCGLRAILT
jgi:hypothetical protein